MNKPKFNPIVTRVKLNPEQAVLACACWQGRGNNTTANNATGATCLANTSPRTRACRGTTRAAIS